MNDPGALRLRLRFWGVRGSIPVPGHSACGFGGNTACLEVSSPGQRETVIVDAGSGIRALGVDLAGRKPASHDVHVLFTHFHWDHVQGLPFFRPLFLPDWDLHFHAVGDPRRLARTLSAVMRPPYFPMRLEDAPARRSFSAIRAAGLSIGALDIQPFPLRHPQPCSGFRITSGGAVIVFATDFEWGDPEHDRILIEHCAGADVLIADAQNTPDEQPLRQGWGHSTWTQAVALAERAGVRELVLFHHDPERSDEALDEIVEQARRRFPATRAAREGELIDV
ncbi:MAG TPA: MBL fold metallo-hydrolase [Vicinamibacterales bacterium]